MVDLSLDKDSGLTYCSVCWRAWEENWGPVEWCVHELKQEQSAGLDVNLVLQRYAQLTVRQWTAVLNMLARQQEATRAMLVLQWVNKQDANLTNEFHYSCVIDACAKRGQWEHALEMLAEAKRKGIEADAITYNSVINACAQGGQWERALEMLAEAKREGIEANAITYNSVINACAKGGQWERALEMLAEAKREGIEVDTITYSSVINACAQGGQWERALEMLAEAKREGIEADTIMYAATLDAVRGRPAEARALWLEALELGLFVRPSLPTPKLWQFDLHEHSEGSAVAAVRWWIETEVEPWHHGPEARSLDTRVELVTGYGKSRKAWKQELGVSGDIKAAVEALLVEMSIPIVEGVKNPGRLRIDRTRWGAATAGGGGGGRVAGRGGSSTE